MRNVALTIFFLLATTGAASAQVLQAGTEEAAVAPGPMPVLQGNVSLGNFASDANFPNGGLHLARRKHLISTAEASTDKMTRRDARAHHDNAVYLAELGRTREAIAEDELAGAGDPNHPGYQILLARLLTDGGQLERALRVYESVEARFPELREDIDECVLGLRAVLSLMRLERTMDHAQSAVALPDYDKNSVQKAKEEVSLESMDTKEILNAVDVDSPERHRAANQEARRGRQFLHRMVADDRPIDDPLY